MLSRSNWLLKNKHLASSFKNVSVASCSVAAEKPAEVVTRFGRKSSKLHQCKEMNHWNEPPDKFTWGFLGNREDKDSERMVRLLKAKIRSHERSKKAKLMLPRISEIKLVWDCVDSEDDLKYAFIALQECDDRLMLLKGSVFQRFMAACIRINKPEVVTDTMKNKFGFYGMKTDEWNTKDVTELITKFVLKDDFDNALYFVETGSKSPFGLKFRFRDYKLILKQSMKTNQVDTVIKALKLRKQHFEGSEGKALSDTLSEQLQSFADSVEDEDKKSELSEILQLLQNQ